MPRGRPALPALVPKTNDAGQEWGCRHERLQACTGTWRRLGISVVRITSGPRLACWALYAARSSSPPSTTPSSSRPPSTSSLKWSSHRQSSRFCLDSGRGTRSGLTSVPRLRPLQCRPALAIWFIRNWVHLLVRKEGESVRVHSEVIWLVVAFLIPRILATTGWRL